MKGKYNQIGVIVRLQESIEALKIQNKFLLNRVKQLEQRINMLEDKSKRIGF